MVLGHLLGVLVYRGRNVDFGSCFFSRGFSAFLGGFLFAGFGAHLAPDYMLSQVDPLGDVLRRIIIEGVVIDPLRAGGDDYLVNAFVVDVILDNLRAFLAAKERHGLYYFNAVLVFGDVPKLLRVESITDAAVRANVYSEFRVCHV